MVWILLWETEPWDKSDSRSTSANTILQHDCLHLSSQKLINTLSGCLFQPDCSRIYPHVHRGWGALGRWGRSRNTGAAQGLPSIGEWNGSNCAAHRRLQAGSSHLIWCLKQKLSPGCKSSDACLTYFWCSFVWRALSSLWCVKVCDQNHTAALGCTGRQQRQLPELQWDPRRFLLPGHRSSQTAGGATRLLPHIHSCPADRHAQVHTMCHTCRISVDLWSW